jgi:hypothetical protein
VCVCVCVCVGCTAGVWHVSQRTAPVVLFGGAVRAGVGVERRAVAGCAGAHHVRTQLTTRTTPSQQPPRQSNRDDAERAIRTLDGYGYDNLILHVEWAAPRAERA